MTLDEYRTFRSLVISLVLATDMANHATLVERMSTYFYLKEMNSTATTTDSKTFLQIVLHAADISNAAKPWPIYIEFAEKIMEEFFLQGDLERVHCTDDKPTFDRETTNVAQLQIGFITHIVSPIVKLTTNFGVFFFYSYVVVRCSIESFTNGFVRFNQSLFLIEIIIE